MTVSKKQLAANRTNALKGGVKTEEGKEAIKLNALKHGLLAQEVVITAGEGAEDPEEFHALLMELMAELNPFDRIEEMLVEKIAAAYWRLRRAHKFEVGLIRQELDNVAYEHNTLKDAWGRTKNWKVDELEKQLEIELHQLIAWKEDKRDFRRMFKNGLDLEASYDWEDSWDWLQTHNDVEPLLYMETLGEEKVEPEILREILSSAGWHDERIWKAFIGRCDERIRHHKERIVSIESALVLERERALLRIDVAKKLGNIPKKEYLDRLLRYEAAINKQFFRALNELIKLQKIRLGKSLPPSIDMNIEINMDESA